MQKLLLLFVCFISVTAWAQETTVGFVNTKEVHPTEWELYAYTEDYKIEYKFVECDPSIGYDQESIIIRITNRTNNKLGLMWYHDLYYDGECRSCDYPEEYRYEIIVSPHSEIEGDCTIYSDYRLKIFSKFTDPQSKGGSALTGFELRGLKITTH